MSWLIKCKRNDVMMDGNGEHIYTYCGEDEDDDDFPYNLYSAVEIGKGYADAGPETIDNKAEAIYLMNEMVRLDTDRARFTYYIEEVT